MAPGAESEPGAADYEQYKDGFHDWLATYWPEPREQLHAGGWRRTAEMVADIKRHLAAGGAAAAASAAVPAATAHAPQGGAVSAGRAAGASLEPTPAPSSGVCSGRPLEVLDICCGEGGTAVHLAATEGWRVTGVDIVESAVKGARARAQAYGSVIRVACQYDTSAHAVGGGTSAATAVRLRLSYEAVSDRATFLHASIFKMPVPSDSYDVVYGQDPDGLANPERVHAFREILRVLRPGGLFYFWHHWIPGPGWPRELLEDYRADPLTGPAPRLSHEEYVADVLAAGFRLLQVSDCNQLAAQHLGAMEQRVKRGQQGKQQAAAGAPAGAMAAGSTGAGGGCAQPHAGGTAGGQAGEAGEEEAGGWTAIPITGWLTRALHFSELAGGSMGVHVVAVKPPAAA